MEDHETKALLARFERELQSAEAEAASVTARAESLREVVRGLRGVLGIKSPLELSLEGYRKQTATAVRAGRRSKPARQGAGSQNGDSPRGREAVRRMLIENRGTMHVDEMVAYADAHEWMQDAADRRNALKAAANRLVDDGEVERGDRPSTYRYRANKLPQASQEVSQGD